MCSWQGSEVGTVLVVCPPTLVRNWARELTRWGPFAVEATVAVWGSGSLDPEQEQPKMMGGNYPNSNVHFQ